MTTLHPGQSVVFKDLFIGDVIRYATVCASRGWGKSYFAATTVVAAMDELLQLHPSVPNKNIYINAGTLDQVKDIYYPILAYDFHLESYAITHSRERGRFELPRGVSIRLMSFENIERMRGKGAYYVVNDEIASWSSKSGKIKTAWQQVIKPCITTRWSPSRARVYGSKPGRGLTISTPKGFNYFYDLHNMEDDDCKSYHYDYRTSPYLDPEEIEKEKERMTEVEYASEYLALFKESGLLVFYCFNRDIHAVNDLKPFQEDEVVHVCIDFNVGIQAASFFALRGKNMEFLDETQGAANTEALADKIKEKYGKHRIYAYPDPTGRARKTSAPVGVTDFSVLESRGIKIRARPSSPPLVDSAKAVNRKLMTAVGATTMYFSKQHCPRLIESMERTSWVEGDTATIDKSEGIEHYSDGVRYAAEYLFPITNVGKRTAAGFSF